MKTYRVWLEVKVEEQDTESEGEDYKDVYVDDETGEILEEPYSEPEIAGIFDNVKEAEELRRKIWNSVK